MQNDGYRNDRYRRHDPRPHDRDEELRAARGYGQDDREHPGIVSDRDWAGPSDYGRGDYERRDYGPGDYGRRDYGSDDDRLRSHRRGGEAFYRDEPSRWGRDDERGRGPGGFGSAAYRDEGSGRRGYGGGSEYRPQYFGGAGYGEGRHEGRAPDAGGWGRGRPGAGRMDHGPGGSQGRPGGGHGGGYYGAAGYSQNDAYAQAGQHRGRGPKGYSRSDERVREDVSDRLADDDMVDASDIEVQVSQGEVTLSGHVDSREAKRRAEDCAESVSGVRHVQNNLRVKTDGWASGASSSGPSLSGSTGTGWSGSSSSSSGLSGSGLSSPGTGSAGSGAESGAAGGASDNDTTSAPRS